MKILIVDDEPLVRIGMKTIIPWEKYGHTIVGEAGDGAQGLKLLLQAQPDIVLVDLKMPIMDGIALIQEAKKEKFKGKFIILSCISEIEYLQKAIELGVSKYILKNEVNPDEILKTINDLAGEMSREQLFSGSLGDSPITKEDLAENEYLDLLLKQVIRDSRERVAEKLFAAGFQPGTPVVVALARLAARDEDSGCLYRTSALAKSLIQENGMGCVFVNFEDDLFFLFQCRRPPSPDELLFRFKTSVKQCFDKELFYEWKEIDLAESELPQSYQALKRELERRFFSGGAEKSGAAGHGTLPACLPVTEFGSYDKLRDALDIIKNMVLQSGAIPEREIKRLYCGTIDYVVMMHNIDVSRLGLGVSTDYGLRGKICAAQSLEEMHTLTLEVLEECCRLAGLNGRVSYSDDLTGQMTQYIHRHYREKISARDVAAAVHFSLDYTCRYFKKKTDVNITDYILKLKIFHAKEELLEGKSVAKLAEEYGFSSDAHFTKTFKKQEGMTPSAYLKQAKEAETSQNSKIST